MGDYQIPKNVRVVIKKILTRISPRLETVLNYRYVCGEWLDWKNPQDLTAKLNILRTTIYYKNPLITTCVDKYRIREYLNEKGLDFICPKLYGVYDSEKEIEWEIFPEQFVIKCNHGCGMNIIVKNKETLDIVKATRDLCHWLKINYWDMGEVQYRFIKKKIIVEEYLGDGEDLKTIKFFCFNGVPKIAYLSMQEDHYIDYYDMNFNHLPYSLPGHEWYPHTLEKPTTWSKMIEIAKILSEDFSFVRVDLYDSNGRLYISELTFIPTGGYMKIDPPEVLKGWGKWLELP